MSQTPAIITARTILDAAVRHGVPGSLITQLPDGKERRRYLLDGTSYSVEAPHGEHITAERLAQLERGESYRRMRY